MPATTPYAPQQRQMTGPLGIRFNVTPPADEWANIERGQSSLEGAVEGYGELLRPELMQQIGTALGGLNSIGALRSGASNVALRDIGTAYTDRVGSYAATTAAQGANIGLEVSGMQAAERERRAQRRRSTLSAIGSVLGAGIGFIAGGPAGAAVGMSLADVGNATVPTPRR